MIDALKVNKRAHNKVYIELSLIILLSLVLIILSIVNYAQRV